MSAAEAGGGPKSPFGPVQMLVLEFDSDHLKGEVLPELRRLKDAGIVRLIDLLVVQKHENGEIEAIQDTDLTQEESMEFGALVGALVGFGFGGRKRPNGRRSRARQSSKVGTSSTTPRSSTWGI